VLKAELKAVGSYAPNARGDVTDTTLWVLLGAAAGYGVGFGSLPSQMIGAGLGAMLGYLVSGLGVSD
jgi:hypothetical protein